MRVMTRRAGPHADARHPAEPLPQLPRGGGVERAQVLAPDGRRQLGELGRECRAQALAQQVVGGGDRLRDGRRGGARGEQGRVGPVRSPRTVRPGGPPCARSAMPVRGEGTVAACLTTAVGAAAPPRSGTGRPCRRSGGTRAAATRPLAPQPPWPWVRDRRRAGGRRVRRPRCAGFAGRGPGARRSPARRRARRRRGPPARVHV